MSVVMMAWLAAATLSSVLGVLQYLDLASALSPWVNQPFYKGDAFANLRQRNQFASLTSVGLVVLLAWAYRIDAAGPGNSGSTVLSSDEPGFEISGDLIKQTSFPNWGIRGAARYRIPGYAVMSRDQGRDWTFVQTGSATGAPVSR
jgi:hypothetical protein